MLAQTEAATWSLPAYSGPHAVGTRLCEHVLSADVQVQLPFCPRLRTLKYRAFYPTSATQGDSAVWSNEAQTRGFANFAGIPSLTGLLKPTLSYLLSHIRLPALVDTPLATTGPFPVVVFSHGLGGTDTSYSAVCGNLASYGIVVFAIEHRDHSASSTIICDDSDDEEHVDYVSPVNQENPELKRRSGYMLQQRNLELRYLVNHIRALTMGTTEDSFFQDALDLELLSLVGHSFGAATILHLIDSQTRTGDLDVRDLEGNTIPLPASQISDIPRSAILLDIWTQPLPLTLNLGGLPILNLVSTQFSLWPQNNDRLESLIEESKNCAVSTRIPNQDSSVQMESVIIRDSLHLAQSDGGLLFPTFTRLVSGYKRSSSRIMSENIERTLDFMMRYNALPEVQVAWSCINTTTDTKSPRSSLDEEDRHGPLGSEIEKIGAASISFPTWGKQSEAKCSKQAVTSSSSSPSSNWWWWWSRSQEAQGEKAIASEIESSA